MKKLFISLVIIWFAVTLSAQENTKTSNFSFSHQPFYMTKNILKMDFDFSIGNGHWLVVSPMFAARENYIEDDYYYGYGYYDDDFDELLGYGITLGHRFYGNPVNVPKGVYFSYQVGWKHYNIEYRDLSWGDINYEGYDAITYDYFDMSTLIDKLGLDILIGYQFTIKEALLLDFYIGGGIRYSLKEYTGRLEREFNYNFTDYGYTGLLPQGGVRLGVIL